MHKRPVVLFAILTMSFYQITLALAENTKPAQIDKTGLLILIRQALTALDLSNKSGNYTILREISAPDFAAVNDAAQLSNNFRSQRERRVDYSGTLVYEPQITLGPEITKEGFLHFEGFFPSASSQIEFALIFSPVNGQWKLFGISADLAPTGPMAPMEPSSRSNAFPSNKASNPTNSQTPSNERKP